MRKVHWLVVYTITLWRGGIDLKTSIHCARCALQDRFFDLDDDPAAAAREELTYWNEAGC